MTGQNLPKSKYSHRRADSLDSGPAANSDNDSESTVRAYNHTRSSKASNRGAVGMNQQTVFPPTSDIDSSPAAREPLRHAQRKTVRGREPNPTIATRQAQLAHLARLESLNHTTMDDPGYLARPAQALHYNPMDDPEYRARLAARFEQPRESLSTAGGIGGQRAQQTIQTMPARPAIQRTNNPPSHPTARVESQKECLGCEEVSDTQLLARLPCNHYWCRVPSCCSSIRLENIHHMLSPELVKRAAKKSAEWSAEGKAEKKRYCATPDCGSFIARCFVQGRVGFCIECGKGTCDACGNEAHQSPECPVDKEKEATLKTAKAERWQQCASCGEMVERRDGCKEMRCTCGKMFCYNCGGGKGDRFCVCFPGPGSFAPSTVAPHGYPQGTSYYTPQANRMQEPYGAMNAGPHPPQMPYAPYGMAWNYHVFNLPNRPLQMPQMTARPGPAAPEVSGHNNWHLQSRQQ